MASGPLRPLAGEVILGKRGSAMKAASGLGFPWGGTGCQPAPEGGKVRLGTGSVGSSALPRL